MWQLWQCTIKQCQDPGILHPRTAVHCLHAGRIQGLNHMCFSLRTHSLCVGLGMENGAVTGPTSVMTDTGGAPGHPRGALAMTGAMTGLQSAAMTALPTQSTLRMIEGTLSMAGSATNLRHMGEEAHLYWLAAACPQQELSRGACRYDGREAYGYDPRDPYARCAQQHGLSRPCRQQSIQLSCIPCPSAAVLLWPLHRSSSKVHL